MTMGVPIEDKEFLKYFKNDMVLLTSIQIASLTGYDKKMVARRLRMLEKLGHIKRAGKSGNRVIWAKQ